MKLKILIIIILTVWYNDSSAENYLLNGGQESRISYRMVQRIEPTAETITLNLSFVVPQSFDSPTYSQKVLEFNLIPGLPPDDQQEVTDMRGNQVLKYSWQKPRKAFDISIEIITENLVNLGPIATDAVYPVKNLPDDVVPYLSGTKMVPVDDPEIRKQAEALAQGAKTQFDIVQRILAWVIDHLNYVLTPEEHGALYALNSGQGNCQNYSHLAAALMRANGIPVRIVNGITLKKPFDVRLKDRTLTLNMAEGRHSWIEVYFSDLGWMPFDPQQTELFVSNRFIRVEVGIDNMETENDGLVHWTRQKGSEAMLGFSETINAQFISDDVVLEGEKQRHGPRKLLLSPYVKAEYKPVVTTGKEAPLIYDQAKMATLKFMQPYTFGNTLFTEGINFAFLRDRVEGTENTSQTLQKNFLVETAAYVTSDLQYCQIFELDKPLQLNQIDIALQKFGGSGQVWLELREDADGNPGPVAAISQKRDLKDLISRPGYYWTSFDFSDQGLLLTPDSYWLSLGFSGTPIINWFYSYGKPVGPVDGTRYKSISEFHWKNSLAYEFIYRISGLIP